MVDSRAPERDPDTGELTTSPATAVPVPPASIAARYRVEAPLGSGGMAVVYRVTDTTSGRQLALKQLLRTSDPARARSIEALFEREFRTLAQLSHPHMVAVHDYAVDAHGPFYTMELLDGGDLKGRSPLPFREAAALLFDVCSSLALLHSRRLLHRDVSPRNIRCTPDGHAKLFDFGAMGRFGRADHTVGTPAFVAPEVLARGSLDARTDLYSVGATLYFALTGRLPYRAHDFSELENAWQRKPEPPASLAADIPPALDALVMSLLSSDPALRPRTAFEVMQRLAASAGLDRSEPPSVPQSYVTAPSLIGRERELDLVRAQLKACRSGGGAALLFRGEPGIGRTRVLEACVLEAKTLGAAAIHVRVDAAGVGSFALAQALIDELCNATFELAHEAATTEPALAPLFESSALMGAPRRLTELALPRPALQAALRRWLLEISARQLLVIAVDDVDRADEASVALLAALAHAAHRRRLLVLASATSAPSESAPAALALLAQASELRVLEPLSPPQIESLLGSIFGDVPNLQLLSARIQASAGGNPRDCMDFVQHLLGHGLISYERGNWTLPVSQQALDLPTSAADAFAERLSGLSTTARAVVEAQALASHAAFTLDDYAVLRADADPQALDAAIDELIAQDVLAHDGEFYFLQRPGIARRSTALLPAAARAEHECALARLYERKGLQLIAVKHALLGGMLETGLTRFSEVMRSHTSIDNLTEATRLSVPEIGRVFEQALPLARPLRPARELAEMQHWLVMLSTGSEERYYTEHAQAWLAQLERDSGLARWRALGEVADCGARLHRALAETNEHYLATPERDRVYSPIEAIQFLAHYVAASLAIGSRTCNGPLLCSLPSVLEPFAPLAPLLDAMYQNALASRDGIVFGRMQSARSRWLDVFNRLERETGPEPQVIRYIRNAVGYAIGLADAGVGLESAVAWADVLDRDHLQAVNAMYLRKITRLAHGDLEGAEHFRRQAELLEVQASARPMFTGTLAVELATHVLANDLTGVRQVMDRIAPLAARFEGWVAFADLAAGQYHRLRGNPAAARTALERCLARVGPEVCAPEHGVSAWPAAVSAYVDVLCALGEAAAARAYGEAALAVCAERGIDVAAHAIARNVALAECELGALDAAATRMESVIAAQRSLGATGLHLGASYEARARIAIAAKDERSIEEYARLTALEYRHGTGAMIVGRYARLLEDAERAGVDTLSVLADLRSATEVTRLTLSRNTKPPSSGP